MALDWSKDISFSGLKKGDARKGKVVYPAKTYMNLLASERTEVDVRRTVLGAILIILIIVVFAKFGVLDFYGKLHEKQAELAAQEQSLASTRVQLASYQDALPEFEAYEVMGTGSTLVVNAMDALALVNSCVMPYADVSSLSLVEDQLQLSLTNTSLDRLSEITRSLEGQAIVQSVSVATASTRQNASDGMTSTVTVTLRPATSAGQGA